MLRQSMRLHRVGYPAIRPPSSLSSKPARHEKSMRLGTLSFLRLVIWQGIAQTCFTLVKISL